MCRCLLTFSYSVVLKAPKWVISSCSLWAYVLQLLVIHQMVQGARICKDSPDFLYRVTLYWWKMPITLPWASNKFQACRQVTFAETHFLYNLFRASCWIQFSVILFFFFFPNNQPHKKSRFHIYNHFKSKLLREHSNVIYHYFSAMLKECYQEIFSPFGLGKIAFLFETPAFTKDSGSTSTQTPSCHAKSW